MNIEVRMRNRALDAVHRDIDNSKGDLKGTPNFRDVTTAAELRQLAMMTS